MITNRVSHFQSNFYKKTPEGNRIVRYQANDQGSPRQLDEEYGDELGEKLQNDPNEFDNFEDDKELQDEPDLFDGKDNSKDSFGEEDEERQ